jgi:hypothetical protein
MRTDNSRSANETAFRQAMDNVIAQHHVHLAFYEDRLNKAEDALLTIANASPPGVASLREFEEWARGIATDYFKGTDR